jgi:hypothetical protein
MFMILLKIIALSTMMLIVAYGAARRDWRRINPKHMAVGLAVIVGVNVIIPMLGVRGLMHTYPVLTLLPMVPLVALYLYLKRYPDKAKASGRTPFDVPFVRWTTIYFAFLVAL